MQPRGTAKTTPEGRTIGGHGDEQERSETDQRIQARAREGRARADANAASGEGGLHAGRHLALGARDAYDGRQTARADRAGVRVQNRGHHRYAGGLRMR